MCGESSTGKTTALKMLIAKLLQDPALKTSVKYCRSKAKIAALAAWKVGMLLPDGDLSVLLDCKGVLVGICTDGDTIGAVWDHIVFFENKNCAVGLTACRPEHLNRAKPCMVAPWNCHEIIDKKKAPKGSEDAENMATATALFDKILKAINASRLNLPSPFHVAKA